MLWKYEFNTGIPLIDSQHKDLFSMINLMEQAIPRGEANKAIATVLKFLVDYTKIHFRDEEAVMADLDYAERGRHVQLHIALVKEVADILVSIRGGRKILGREIFDFLRHWLADHILKEDMQLKEIHARKLGISYGGMPISQGKRREGVKAKLDILESLRAEGLLSAEACEAKRREILAEEVPGP